MVNKANWGWVFPCHFFLSKMPGHKMKSFGRSFRESPNVGKEFAQKKTSLENKEPESSNMACTCYIYI